MNLRVHVIEGVPQIREASFELSNLAFAVAEYLYRNEDATVVVGDRVFHFGLDGDRVLVDTAWHTGDTVDSMAVLYQAAIKTIQAQVSDEVKQVEMLKKRLKAINATTPVSPTGS